MTAANATTISSRREPRTVTLIVAAGALVVASVVTTLALTRRQSSPNITFTAKTFEAQAVFTTRFAADGKTILFSAAPEGHTPRIYIIRPEYPEARPVSDSGVQLLSISSKDEMAVLTDAKFLAHRLFVGTLARMPIGGGAPRPVLESVREADWSPDGTQLAVIHVVQGRDRLEYPIGKPLYTAPRGYISDVRVSPRGDRVAFHQHPTAFDNRGEVMTVDLSGKTSVLATDFWGIEATVWSPDGSRLLFSAAVAGTGLQIRSVDRPGSQRVVLANAGDMIIHDASRDGTWLTTRDDEQFRLLVRAPGGQPERDITWLNFIDLPVISHDGRMVAFSNEGVDGGPNYTVMVRGTDGSPAVKIGEGMPISATHDFRWVLAEVLSTPPHVNVYPTGPGEPKRVDRNEFDALRNVAFGRNEQSVYICGVEHSGTRGCYEYPLSQGPRKQITAADTTVIERSPDEKLLLMRTDAGVMFVRSMEAPASDRVLTTVLPTDEFLRWSPDARAIWVRRSDEIPLRVTAVDIATGRRTALAEFQAKDQHGLVAYPAPSLADDPKVAAFVVRRYLSQIFVVTGAR